MRNGRPLRSVRAVRSSRTEYLLGAKLGVGGMGIVYAATTPHQGESVAVKFLHPERASDERARRRFDGEALAGRVISHPNVASVLDEGTMADGARFLVMEHVRGEPLGGRLARDGAVSPLRAVRIAHQLLSGLASVHAAGIVHADVKSDNVLVESTADGVDRCKLIDFGLACVQFTATPGRGEASVETEEWLSGTPEYMAPEMIRGGSPSFASDLYAVGIILYELLTGTTPFAGGTPTEIVTRHVADEIVPPSLRCERFDLPTKLDEVVVRAVQKEPHERFASAQAFADALAALEPELAALVRHEPELETAPTLSWQRDAAPTLVGSRRRFATGTPSYLTSIAKSRG